MSSPFNPPSQGDTTRSADGRVDSHSQTTVRPKATSYQFVPYIPLPSQPLSPPQVTATIYFQFLPIQIQTPNGYHAHSRFLKMGSVHRVRKNCKTRFCFEQEHSTLDLSRFDKSGSQPTITVKKLRAWHGSIVPDVSEHSTLKYCRIKCI